MNKYPVIDRVTLHTDNNGIGAVYTTHTGNAASSEYRVPASMPAGYLNTGFISKNKLIGFELRTLHGNAPLNYRLHYVTRKEVALTEVNLEAFATKRSLQGWYSFYQGETNIYALGYNLKGQNNTAMKINSSDLAVTSQAIAGASGKTDYTRFLDHIEFTVPDAANSLSGEIVLTANNGGAVAALNHSADDAKSWNREYWRNTDGSELWVNKPHAHIWRSRHSDTVPTTYFIAYYKKPAK